MMQTGYETYQYAPEENGRGMYFHTDCGNWMYSVKTDIMAYHGCLCPRCLSNGKYTTLYLRGTPEANRVIKAGMTAI